jgi:hypothetical protein
VRSKRNVFTHKLGIDGFSHDVVLVLLVVAIGLFGTFYLVFAHAATATLKESGYLSSGISNSAGTSTCLNDLDNATKANTIVKTYACDTKYSASEKWSLYSDNSIRLHGLCLAVAGSSKTSGATVEMSTCNGSKNEQWTIGANATVSLNDLVNGNSGDCLDVSHSGSANNTTIDDYSCNGTVAQVWGWNTGSTIVAGGATAGNNCKYIGGFGSSCVVQMGAYQANTGNYTATGVSANFTIYDPSCGKNCVHVANEFQVGSSNMKNLIEYGWTIAGDVPIGTHPELQIGLWANGDPLDADANFVQVSKTVKMNEILPVNGTVGNLKILYVSSSNQWQLFYNGTEVGYYPESIWTSRGTSLTNLQDAYIFGEVYPSNPLLAAPVMQMGSGKLAGQPGAATISDFTLYGSTTAPNLSVYTEGNQKLWSLSNMTATGFSYGGLGTL